MSQPVTVYFRNINQMDEDMQKQMVDYVNALEDLPQLGSSPEPSTNDSGNGKGNNHKTNSTGINKDEIQPFCWVRDFPKLKEEFVGDNPNLLSMLSDLSFVKQLDMALKEPLFREVYGRDIIRDSEGNITASRCSLFISNLDMKNIHEQIALLEDQRMVTQAQPINQVPPHDQNWAFFSYSDQYMM